MILRGAMVGIVTAWLAGAAWAQEPARPQTEKQAVSYALGMNLASQFKAQALDVDDEFVHQGLRDGLSGGKTLLTDKEVGNILAGLRERLRRKLPVLHTERAAKNKEAEEAFLEANRTKDGIVALESGLQYRVLREGSGRTPTVDDRVVIHYRGTLIDGTEFDSTYGRKEPATFAVRRVVKGWSEALQRMPVGSKWQLFIPSRLAYGERGSGPRIGPNATLIFDVELIAIVDAMHAAAAEPAKARQGGVVRVAVQDQPGTAPAAGGVKRILLSFKMDARLATGTYGSKDRWVSPPTLMRIGEGDTCTIEVRARGVGTGGRSVSIEPKWSASDPEMVTLTPGDGSEVKIVVRRAGESSVRIASDGVSRELAIKAAYVNNVFQATVSQK